MGAANQVDADYHAVAELFEDWSARVDSIDAPLTQSERVAYSAAIFGLCLDSGSIDGLVHSYGPEVVEALQAVSLTAHADALQLALNKTTEQGREQSIREIAFGAGDLERIFAAIAEFLCSSPSPFNSAARQ